MFRRYPQRCTVTVTKEMAEKVEQKRERRFLDSGLGGLRVMVMGFIATLTLKAKKKACTKPDGGAYQSGRNG